MGMAKGVIDAIGHVGVDIPAYWRYQELKPLVKGLTLSSLRWEGRSMAQVSGAHMTIYARKGLG